MTVGPFKIKLEGPQGSGKSHIINLIVGMLQVLRINYIINEDAHTIEIIKND